MAKIIIPTPLRKFTDNQANVAVSGGNIAEAFGQLAEQFPGLRQQIFDEHGAIRKFVRVYIGEEDIKALQNEQTPVAADTVISIIPAIAGGAQ